jgi:TRAP-type C4-dicarboxylate transport system substrate-binding protein
VEPGFKSSVWVILINRASWNGLTTAHRDALARAAQAIEAADAKRSAQRDADTRRAEEEAGLTSLRLGETDAATLVLAAQEMGWEGLSQIDSENTKRLRNLLAK